MNDFQKEIKNNFDFLFNIYGFSFVEENNLDEDFKEVVFVIQTKEIKIRFIKDRADFFLDVGSTIESEKWYSFYKILNWLKVNNYIDGEFKPVNKIKNISSLFRQYCELILEFFSLEKYEDIKNMID